MSTALFDSEALADEAVVLRHDGKYSEAEAKFKSALEKRISAVGENDRSVAELLKQLGENSQIAGDAGAALTYFQKAVTVLEVTYYAGHALIAPILEHMTNILFAQGKFAEAEPVCQRALEISDKTLSGEHRQTLALTVKMAAIEMKLDKFAEAEKLLTKSSKNVDSPLGPLEEYQFMLAQIQEQLGKPEEADKLYKAAAAALEQRKSYATLVACLDKYVAFLKKQSRQKEVPEIEQKAAKFKAFCLNWHHNPDIFSSTLLRA
jgi:tetratricopeptide (TPR) repeat protein